VDTCANNGTIGGMGWRPDLPDIRDYTPEEPQVEKLLAKS
jgi:hypothetical protein